MITKSNWEIYFCYEDQGTTCTECDDGHIWLDIGNSGVEGVFDHHVLGDGSGSTVELLVNNIPRLAQALERAASARKLTVHLHRKPDLDACAAAFLVKEFLELGAEGFADRYDTERGRYRSLIHYIGDIDSGKGKEVAKLTLYAASTWLYYVLEERGVLRFNRVIEEIWRYIGIVQKVLDDAPNTDLRQFVFPEEIGDALSVSMRELAAKTADAYEQDKQSNILESDIGVEIFTKLETKEGKIVTYGVEKVKAAIWKEPPTYENEYVLARHEGKTVLTFVPHMDNGVRGVRVSINPDIPGYEKYTLTPFAEIVEIMEQRCDIQVLEQTGRLPRDYSKWRGGNEREHRFAESPFSTTADPWYFSEDGDMVDTPGKGTALQWEELIEILKRHTHFIKSSYMIDFSAETGQEDVKVSVACVDSCIAAWKRYCCTEFSKIDREFRFLITEIDAEMIAHSYDVLDSYYSILVGASPIDKETCSAAHIDYRTHLYCNMRCGVLFIATRYRFTGDNILGGLLDLSSETSVRESKFTDIVLSLVRSRKQLTDISRFLEGLSLRDKRYSMKKIKEQNMKLLHINSRIRTEKVMDSQVGYELYQCMSTGMGIEPMRSEVNEEMAVVCEYSKENIFGTFELLSVLTLPFVVLGSLFQIGFIQLAPLFKIGFESGDRLSMGTVVGWAVFFLAIAAITMILLKRKR